MSLVFVGCLTCLYAGSVWAGDIFVGNEDGGAVVLSNVPSDDDYLVLVKSQDETAALPEISTPGHIVGGPKERDARTVVGRAAPYALLVDAAARESRVDPNLLHAVIATESAYNPVARSRKGALGLTQLMPETAKRYGVADAYDPRQNIVGGARYLSDLLTLFDQDVQLALAAYNAGEHAVLRHGRRIPPYRETMAYIPRVLGYYKVFSKRTY